jgi:hypothetical protein
LFNGNAGISLAAEAWGSPVRQVPPRQRPLPAWTGQLMC